MKQSIQVGVVMGSNSDWETMVSAVEILRQFDIAHEARVVSAHRMPDALFAYAEGAAARGLAAIIAGAGGAAHLPGMLAAKTTVPVLGVPVASRHLQGVDSLYSIVQMPRGVPVATFAIGPAGAANAALFAVAMLAVGDPALRRQLDQFRARQTEVASNMSLPPPAAAGEPRGAAPMSTGLDGADAPREPVPLFSPQGGGAL
ncbi:N5-carboxyaminoimidazole ribonucleotide mutase [Burkholderiales bacterium 8X]|nr:N5-carboxyaminoimidazole ribonucleotide mutase [Burkholderiales bacterium 8X]